MSPPGARLEMWAPSQAPGTAPIRSDEATANENAPNSRWPAAAAATSGIAWARSVPTSDDALSRGYMSSSVTTTIDPAPTDVSPTIRPATAPSASVGSGRTTIGPGRVNGAGPSPSGSRLRHIWSEARTTRPPMDTSSAVPRICLRIRSSSAPCGISEISQAPANAAGTDPRHSHLTSCRFTVPARRWTAAPTGFISRLTTMSLEIAVNGLTLNRNTSMGVISAPPPIPVSPTTVPTTSPPSARGRSKVTRPTEPRRGRRGCEACGDDNVQPQHDRPRKRAPAPIDTRSATPRIRARVTDAAHHR